MTCTLPSPLRVFNVCQKLAVLENIAEIIWRNGTTLQWLYSLKVLPEVYHCRFLYILYLKEINELLLWSGSVWTSFTLKVFCGTVCNEVRWIFSLACRVLLLSRCWFGYFFITLLKCTAEGEIMIKGKTLFDCAGVPCINAIHPLFPFSLWVSVLCELCGCQA